MFGSQQAITSSEDGAWSVYAVDRDGDADVLSASYLDDKIAWCENLGSGSFGAPQVITTNADGARDVYATDLDDDGDADVLSASSNDDKIGWYANLSWTYKATQASGGDVTLILSGGQGSALYYIFHSTDPLNETLPGAGIIGLHIPAAHIGQQVMWASQGNPLFGGTLDSAGRFAVTLPGAVASVLSGQTWYGMGVYVRPGAPAPYETTGVQSITFQ